jgi:DDT domain
MSQAARELVAAWGFLHTFGELLGVWPASLTELLAALVDGACSRLTAELHIGLLRLLQVPDMLMRQRTRRTTGCVLRRPPHQQLHVRSHGVFPPPCALWWRRLTWRRPTSRTAPQWRRASQTGPPRLAPRRWTRRGPGASTWTPGGRTWAPPPGPRSCASLPSPQVMTPNQPAAWCPTQHSFVPSPPAVTASHRETGSCRSQRT